MAYEHDHTGARPVLRDEHGIRREGSGGAGLAILLGAIAIALIVAIYVFSGRETVAPTAPATPEVTAPTTDPAATAPAEEPAVDPASDPAGAIPGVEPMVPADEPAPAPAD